VRTGITKLGKRWVVRVTAVSQRTGKLRSARRYVDTLEEAEALRPQLYAELREDLPEVSRKTTGDYAKSWCERTLPRLRTAGSREFYVAALSHFLRKFGDTYIDALRPADLDGWLVSQRDYSPATVNGWWRVARAMLRRAVSDLQLPLDPTFGVRPLPCPPRTSPNTLDAEGLSRFLACARTHEPRWHRVLTLGFALGARSGELSALEWGDLQGGILTIQRSQRKGNVGPTKNGDPRAVELPAALLSLLDEQREYLMRKGIPNPRGLMFPVERRSESRYGGYWQSVALDKAIRRIAVKAGLEGRYSSKVMRRTFNDLARHAKIDPLVIRGIVGHSSDEMRWKYSTLATPEKAAAVATVIAMVQP